MYLFNPVDCMLYSTLDRKRIYIETVNYKNICVKNNTTKLLARPSSARYLGTDPNIVPTFLDTHWSINISVYICY